MLIDYLVKLINGYGNNMSDLLSEKDCFNNVDVNRWC